VRDSPLVADDLLSLRALMARFTGLATAKPWKYPERATDRIRRDAEVHAKRLVTISAPNA
jgi:hypothetical protein